MRLSLLALLVAAALSGCLGPPGPAPGTPDPPAAGSGAAAAAGPPRLEAPPAPPQGTPADPPRPPGDVPEVPCAGPLLREERTSLGAEQGRGAFRLGAPCRVVFALEVHTLAGDLGIRVVRGQDEVFASHHGGVHAPGLAVGSLAGTGGAAVLPPGTYDYTSTSRGPARFAFTIRAA